ncbi:DUF6706 family protein [Ornithobacterium rhinotracheale]|uniref:DUF6706 family protein n=1 Tax=Ornithobacterium rhinotracheale TaxID=28251 RepID=UPI001FF40229|nr:DUF6706 family protein [Ornithobacterium rhinotracheale]MCK0201378.1 hypothetical protein [Ornithobacterium rhinotracheale]
MTALEYIKEQLRACQANMSDGLLIAEMNAVGLHESAEIDMDTRTKAQRAMFQLIPTVMLSPSSVSEGGYSISYDKESLMNLYRLLAHQLGEEDNLSKHPIVTDISDRFW